MVEATDRDFNSVLHNYPAVLVHSMRQAHNEVVQCNEAVNGCLVLAVQIQVNCVFKSKPFPKMVMSSSFPSLPHYAYTFRSWMNGKEGLLCTSQTFRFTCNSWLPPRDSKQVLSICRFWHPVNKSAIQHCTIARNAKPNLNNKSINYALITNCLFK